MLSQNFIYEIFIISRFFKSSYFCLKSKTVFWQFLVNILPLGSGSVDPHIFDQIQDNPQGMRRLEILYKSDSKLMLSLFFEGRGA